MDRLDVMRLYTRIVDRSSFTHPVKGTYIGTLQTDTGPFAQDGLWGIAFGNDSMHQPHNTLFFTAGPNKAANGLYGRIDLPAM